MSNVEAAGWLAAQQVALAEQITEGQLAAMPELAARYGPAGRLRCVEDARHHLTYLQQAVGTGQAALFTSYVAWAKVLLANLGIPGIDLEANLGHLREAIRAAAAPQVAAYILPTVDAVLEGFDALPTKLETQIDPRGRHAGLARRYLDLLLAGSRREASTLILDAVNGGVPVAEVYLQVFQPVQYEIGRLWQMNQVTVAQEHYCTAATQMVMSQLYPFLFAGEHNGRKLVVACVSGDLHEIGARVLTDLFECEGWDTFYVGANTPTSSIVSTVRDEAPDLVALSATMAEKVPVVREVIEALRAQFPGVPILVGGYPFIEAPDLWKELGADGTAVDARAAIALAHRLVDL